MITEQTIPQHVGIIMDGNRRWATSKGLPIIEGHRQGYHAATRIATHAFAKGVRYLTLFAFSTENWNRATSEVSYLMDLFLRMIKEQLRVLHRRGVRIKFIGLRSRLDARIRKAIVSAQAATRQNKKGTLLIALNYGGRHEIVDAVRSIVKRRTPTRDITPELVERELWTAGIPDPDLIIRTSGEQRLSGFLLWQAAYSELYFSEKLWPAFSEDDFNHALEVFATRQRRFGA